MFYDEHHNNFQTSPDTVIIPIGLEPYNNPHGIDFIVNIGIFDPKAHLEPVFISV